MDEERADFIHGNILTWKQEVGKLVELDGHRTKVLFYCKEYSYSDLPFAILKLQ